jgi:hypothetical protein
MGVYVSFETSEDGEEKRKCLFLLLEILHQFFCGLMIAQLLQ